MDIPMNPIYTLSRFSRVCLLYIRSRYTYYSATLSTPRYIGFIKEKETSTTFGYQNRWKTILINITIVIRKTQSFQLFIRDNQPSMFTGQLSLFGKFWSSSLLLRLAVCGSGEPTLSLLLPVRLPVDLRA